MTIKIGDVLFPLRYDIVAQAPFVTLYNSQQYWSDKDLMQAARDLLLGPHIEMLHEHERKLIGKEPLRDGHQRQVTFERYYRARVEKLAELCNSLSERWDYTEDPLMFNRPPEDGLTSMGNPVPPGHFLCNGQHRMIVLYGMGVRELKPKQYGLRPMGPDFVPLETTGTYVKAGLITPEQFVEFARLRLAIPLEVTTVDSLAEWARDHALAWLTHYITLYWGTT